MTDHSAAPDHAPRQPTAASLDRDLQILSARPSRADAERAYIDGVLGEPVTGLPSFPVMLHRMSDQLQQHGRVALLTVHVSPTTPLERVFGWATFDRVVQSVCDLLQGIQREHLRRDDFLAELSLSGSAFVLVLSPSRQGQTVQYLTVSSVRERIHNRLAALIRERFPEELASQFECYIGCAVIDRDTDADITRATLRGLDAAYADAFGERNRGLEERRLALQRIIDGRLISVALQPVVDLEAGRVFAYEALTRCPDPQFQSVRHLFAVAAETNLLMPLERLCWETATRHFLALPEQDTLLFVNIDAESVIESQWRGLAELSPLAGRGVLEITERAAVRDYRVFRGVLQRLGELGLRFAIDDVGSGYSGLRLIVEAQPAFIKLDMGITRGVGQEELRRELVSLLRKFTQRAGATLIVQGVETRDELQTLRDLGVRYVQGYVFGAPMADPSTIDIDTTVDSLGYDRLRTLTRRLASVQAELAAVERDVLELDAPLALLEEFKLALDHTRTNIWALFSAADPGARRRVATHFRLKRMVAMSRQVLADLKEGTITPASPDFLELRAALDHLDL